MFTKIMKLIPPETLTAVARTRGLGKVSQLGLY